MQEAVHVEVKRGASGISLGRMICSLLIFLLVITEVPSALLALFLLLDGETWTGRLFGISWLVHCVFVFCIFLRLQKFKGGGAKTLVITGVTSTLGLVACFLMAPPGLTPRDARFQSVYPANSHYSRWTPAGMVPEMDQIKLGSDLSAWVDRLMTRAKSERMKSLSLAAYREMEKDPDFASAGSALGYAYADLFQLPCDQQHLFAYVPEHEPGQKLPVLLFLHGSGGNFIIYPWTWKHFADAHQVAIVAPTFGFGNWNHPGGMESIDAAFNYCAKHPDMDIRRVILAGLSNGGIGVSRAFCRNPERFCGLVYISAVMEPDVMYSWQFQHASAGKWILALHGDQDERIPVKYVTQPMALLPDKSRVESKIYPQEDHFLFLSRKEDILNDVHNWMKRIQ